MWSTTFKGLLEIWIVQHVKTKGVFTFQPRKILVSTTVKRAHPAVECLIFHSKTKVNHDLIWWRRHHLLWKKEELRLRQIIPFLEKICPPITIYHNRTREPKGKKWLRFWYKRGELPLAHKKSKTFNFWFNSYSFTLYSSCLIFTVFNKKIQWFLDFGPDSLILTVKGLLPEMTKSSRGFLLSAWNFLSQGQNFLDPHLARIQSLPTSNEYLKSKRKFSLMLECKIWIPEAMSYRIWMNLKSSEKILSCNWMLSLDRK